MKDLRQHEKNADYPSTTSVRRLSAAAADADQELSKDSSACDALSAVGVSPKASNSSESNSSESPEPSNAKEMSLEGTQSLAQVAHDIVMTVMADTQHPHAEAFPSLYRQYRPIWMQMTSTR